MELANEDIIFENQLLFATEEASETTDDTTTTETTSATSDGTDDTSSPLTDPSLSVDDTTEPTN